VLVDVKHDKIYFQNATEAEENLIMVSNLEGKNAHIFAVNTSANGMVLNEGILYWVDIYVTVNNTWYNRVLKSSADNGTYDILFIIPAPSSDAQEEVTALDIDFKNKLMYISLQTAIYKCNFTGDHWTIVWKSQYTSDFYINDIAIYIGADGPHLYWTQSSGQIPSPYSEIKHSNMDGSNVEPLFPLCDWENQLPSGLVLINLAF